MFDVTLFGLDAGRHHQVNLCWHVLNVLLLFLILNRVTSHPRPIGNCGRPVFPASLERRIGGLDLRTKKPAQHFFLAADADDVYPICRAAGMAALCDDPGDFCDRVDGQADGRDPAVCPDPARHLAAETT